MSRAEDRRGIAADASQQEQHRMTLAETIAAELTRARAELATAEAGHRAAPDDAEWPILIDATREQIAAIERIAAAVQA